MSLVPKQVITFSESATHDTVVRGLAADVLKAFVEDCVANGAVLPDDEGAVWEVAHHTIRVHCPRSVDHAHACADTVTYLTQMMAQCGAMTHIHGRNRDVQIKYAVRLNATSSAQVLTEHYVSMSWLRFVKH
jgi:hypothetical protein